VTNESLTGSPRDWMMTGGLDPPFETGLISKWAGDRAPEESCRRRAVVTLIEAGTGNHYAWGGVCDGWALLETAGMSIIEERMPPGSVERLHVHHVARQFFYVLEGAATMRTSHGDVEIGPYQGFLITPGEAHQVRNDSCYDLRFLAIGNPSTRGDRMDLDISDAPSETPVGEPACPGRDCDVDGRNAE
jgi:mannose-6-phosphate isomerase-like protein (cupin superfamily)